MKLFAKSAMLLMLAALSTIFVSAQSEINSAKKAEKVFSDKSLELEIKKLRQMKAADKIKVRKAIEDLEAASQTASFSTDMDEISSSTSGADNSVETAVAALPDGALKDSLISSNKALGNSFYLRLVSAGKKNPNDADTAKLLEEIIIRYKLAKIPKHKRAAEVLTFVDFFVISARLIASEADIVEKAF